MDMMNKFSLEGKVALVTGASHGIGMAIAEAFASCGAKICFNCSSEGSKAKAIEAYKAKGIDAHGYVCDVCDEEAVKALVAQIKEEVGVIDILVNNAGIIKRIPMLEMSAEDFRKVIDVDLNAPFIVSKAVIPGMIEKGHGKIINICSMMSELGRHDERARPRDRLRLRRRKGRSENADQEHLLRVRRTQHPVQRHRPRLHRHQPDRASA